MLYSDAVSAHLTSFLCSRTHLGKCVALSCHISLASSWLWQFIRPFLFLMTLTVLRGTREAFCKMSPNWDVSLNWDLRALGRKSTEVKCHFHQRYILYTCFITVDNNRGHLAEVVFFRLLHYKPTLFIPSFPIVPFRRNALSEAPIQSGDLLGIFFRWSNYIYYLKSFLIFLFIEYIFNHLIMCLYQYGLRVIYFILSVIIQNYVIYFVAQNIPALVFGSSLQVVHLSDPRHCVWGGGGKVYVLNTSLLSGRQATPSSLGIFPASILESVISPRRPGFFYWRIKDLGTKFNKIF